MGRSSKFIASEVRLRSPSWKAWAFVSIALCPAFVGVDTASAGPVSVPITVPKVNVPTVSVPRVYVPTVSVPKFNVPTVSVPKFNVPTVSVPRVNLSTANVPTATNPPSGFDRTLKGGPWVRNIHGHEVRTTEGRSPYLQAPPSHDGPGPNGGDATASNGDDARAQSNGGDVGGARPERNVGGTPAKGGIAGKMSKTLGGDTLGGAPVGGGPPVPRAYAPESYGSVTSCLKANSDHSAPSIMGSRPEDSCNTVCGRYPYPPCH